jgi:light-regulated signal transduction histidine kinase (bacteriophytochrome)/CheY-like chemotaxis protein/HPt (histidine-containing phosphotransfer) domain-containing protein
MEYLRNLGVQASMSISLKQNGQLWGLIACHHKTPKRLSNTMRQVLLYLHELISDRLSAYQALTAHNLSEKKNQICAKLLKMLPTEPLDYVIQNTLTELYSLIDSCGVIVSIDGKRFFHGEMPGDTAMQTLFDWLGSQISSSYVCVEELSNAILGWERNGESIAGVLSTAPCRDMANSIIWLRRSKEKTVKWAGKYSEGLVRNDAGEFRLKPRKSFEIWKQSWHDRSEPWDKQQLSAVIDLWGALNDGLAKKALLELETQARILAEQELLRQQSELQNLVLVRTKELSLATQKAQVGTFTWYYPTDRLDWDDQIRQIYGIVVDDQSEDSYKLWCERVHPDDLEQAERALRDAVSKHTSFDQPFRIVRPDGEIRFIQPASFSITDDQGELCKIIVINHDISPFVQQELALRKAKEMAESANFAKSAFLATMSHEIRTPLNAVIGSSYLLSQSRLTDEQRDFLTTIESSSKNLLAVINDVLDFSKIEAGEFAFETHVFSLADVVHDMRAMFSANAAAEGLEFVVSELPTELPLLLIGDDNRLRQILINLVGNALKFTAQGSVRIDVDLVAHVQQDQSLRLRFSVADTGIGIKDDALPSLFNPFIQADQSTSRIYGGTGLGLSIVKRLAELMGGHLGVESQYGHGSTFTVELPFGISDDAHELARIDAHVARQIHVLVAEDDPLDRQVMIRMCGQFGWNVESVENGQDMLARVIARAEQNHAFDCIVLDWQMPVMDGLQALAELKKQLSQRVPSVIMVTAHDIQTLNRAMTDAKPDSVLVKPVEPSSLFNHVNEAVLAHNDDLGYLLSGTLIESAHSRWLDGVRILVVDDSAINLKVLEQTLKNHGALPTVCDSGEAALAAINQSSEAFDLVFMDMQMPGMDGCETTRTIRADSRFEKLPVLALTAAATSTEKTRALESGMNDFLTKPIEPLSLVRKIRHYLEQSRGEPLPLVVVRDATATESLVQTEATTQTQDNWPRIDGIDSARSKKLMLGDKELFNEVLQMFVRENAEADTEIQTLLNAGESALAAKCAHKLGGQGGAFGATELQQLALALEQALLMEKDDVENNLRSFQACFTRLVQSIVSDV